MCYPRPPGGTRKLSPSAGRRADTEHRRDAHSGRRLLRWGREQGLERHQQREPKSTSPPMWGGRAMPGRSPASTTDVILNATTATTKQGNPLTETLGASTIINSLNVNNNGTTTLPGDELLFDHQRAGDSNRSGTTTGGVFTGNYTAIPGTGIGVASGANAFTVNVPLVLGNSRSPTPIPPPIPSPSTARGSPARRRRATRRR